MTTGLPTLPPSTPSTPRSRRGWLAGVLVVFVASGSAVGWWQFRRPEQTRPENNAPRAAALDDTSARAPVGRRVRVRVMNVSGVAGLARRTTQHLREYGFDVVDFGSGPKEAAARTRIAVHTGRAEWATRVQRALGLGEVVNAPDSLRYADLTVFVGNDWRPPAETLRP